ncbi:MAG: ammonium transporter [Luteolibacter sp.]
MTCRYQNKLRACLAAAVAFVAIPLASTAFGQEEPAPAPPPVEASVEAQPAPSIEERLAALESSSEGVNSGDNAWMLTSSALVLFMSLPGLALFYGGIVRRKNVLSIFGQIFAIAGIAAIAWWAVGYTLAFGADGGKFFGGLGSTFFKGVGGDPGSLGTVSENIFAIFQLTFAIITPALIIGAVAERIKFSAIIAFVVLWLFAVYFPFAHMVWGGGLIHSWDAIDFAGGTVVHMTSGFSALTLAIILGKRKGYGKEPLPPHSVVLTAIGTGILWVGWYGFNAGSAGAADGVAGNAFATTTFAAAIAGLSWGAAEWLFKGKPSVLGICSGVIGGLVAITPAAGFVTVGSSIIFGLLGGFVPFLAVAYLKKMLGYDDALDTFGVHGVGGALGAILTGVFASSEVSSTVADLNAANVNLVLAQVKAVALTAVWSVGATIVIAYLIKATIGLRPSEEVEELGLDLAEHGEQGYEH